MAKCATVDDEIIIAALLEHGTVRAAADSLNISTRTIYDRRRSVDFQMAYNDAKTEVFRSAVYDINKRLSEAVEVVAGIMNDPDNNPAVRLQAAQTILNNAAKFSARLESSERESRTMKDPFDMLGFDL